MRKQLVSLSTFVLFIFTLIPAFSQSSKGVIIGVVKDSAGAVLQGAKIELQPQMRPISTNELGEFNINEVSSRHLHRYRSPMWASRPTARV